MIKRTHPREGQVAPDAGSSDRRRPLRALLGAAASVGVVLGVVLGAAVPAQAWTAYYANVSGEVDIYGSLYQYGVPRAHAAAGSEYVQHTTDSVLCGGAVTFGLRVASGTQVTTSVAAPYNSVTYTFYAAGTTNPSIPAGTHYINARGVGAACGASYYYFFANFWI